MSIRIITDSASDIIDNKKDNLTVLPLTVTIGSDEYLDGVNLSHSEFYEKLIESDELPKTSQVPPFVFEEEYEKAKELGETVIVITLSSKLSGTYQSANIARVDYEDMVYVIDSENVCVGERVSVEYALRLVEEGLDASEIVAKVEAKKKSVKVLGLLDTLEYLKKGGRISPAKATIGAVLNIKPVIAIVDGEVELLGKARGSKQGNNFLIEQIEKSAPIDFSMPLYLGYAGLSDKLINKYIEDSQRIWKGNVEELNVVTVGATIGTHVGPGAIALAYYAKK